MNDQSQEMEASTSRENREEEQVELSDNEDIISVESGFGEFIATEIWEESKTAIKTAYRYIMIEGTPNQSELQNSWARKCNIKINSNWDLIDVDNQLFVELKVTGNVDHRQNFA